jgi:16S rRNA (adenine1518-N6/adenine1519-N6)-dimethyltransferase
MPAKSKLGQNFLCDDSAIRHIAAALGDLTTRTVIEIGPGLGAITKELAAKAGHLIAVEYDGALAKQLHAQFTSEPPGNITVVHQDILDFDFAVACAAAGRPLLVVGNLPYYITSPILLKLAANAASIDRAVLMVQREVADRVTAHPGTRDYGLLSTTVQLYGNVEKLFTLPPEAFTPSPEVHSTVFRWRFAPRITELAVNETKFLAFLRQCFAQKRKTLANNLKAAGFATNKIADSLRSSALAPQARAESVSIEEFALLWRNLCMDETADNY